MNAADSAPVPRAGPAGPQDQPGHPRADHACRRTCRPTRSARCTRYRWQIELFFRWLKVWANLEHLISHSPNGLTMPFYVAVIGVLLMYVNSGRRVSKYAYLLLQQVALGLATAAGALALLDEVERRKDLERARLAARRQRQRQRAAQTKA